MSDVLECPGPSDNPDWGSLYLYREAEVVELRPVFTGDVFFGVDVQGAALRETKDVIVIQHPCALRTDGVNLVESLLVVEVMPDQLYRPREWKGNYKLMPLPELRSGEKSHFSARFTSPLLASAEDLNVERRVACMSPVGVNLLLQRWVYHNSRAAIHSSVYDDAVSAQFEEADAIEEWCTTRAKVGVSLGDATSEADAWLSDSSASGIPPRVQMENRQYRTTIRKTMRRAAKERNSAA